MPERLPVGGFEARERELQVRAALYGLSDIVTFAQHNPGILINTQFKHPYPSLNRLLNYPIFQINDWRVAVPYLQMLSDCSEYKFTIVGFWGNVNAVVDLQTQREIIDGDALMCGHLEPGSQHNAEVAFYMSQVKKNRTANVIGFLNDEAARRWATDLDHVYLSHVVGPKNYKDICIGYGTSQGLTNLQMHTFWRKRYETQNPA